MPNRSVNLPAVWRQGDRSPLRLATRIASGGEGAVFSIQGLDQALAKIYHQDPSPERQEKLRLMVKTGDSDLRRWVAWPLETLHSPGGGVAGFVMPKIVGGEALHSVYSSAHRRVEHPDRAWSFLVTTGYNLAFAMAAIHGRGHVIGDVNQNGFIVTRDARVHVIDSDSFQIRVGDALHKCLVGVPEFTPPELQGEPHFGAIERTPDHDCFGLAVLIFQLLLGGRHPFSGRPLRQDVGNDMAADIRHYRYCHAPDHNARGLEPPPRAVPISILPSDIQAYFLRAFTESGVRSRPTARQWVDVLSRLLKQIRQCPASEAHHHWNGSQTCPWCLLEKSGVQHFVVSTAPTAARSQAAGLSRQALDRLLAEVAAVPTPMRSGSVTIAHSSVTPTPFKAAYRTSLHHTVLFISALLVVGLIAFGVLNWWLGILSWMILNFASYRASRPARKELAERRARLEETRAACQKTELAMDAYSERFDKALERFRERYSKYQSLASLEDQELQSLRGRKELILRKAHLQSCFLDAARVPGVGDKLKTALRGFGVETALDVQEAVVRAVPGVGPAKAQALLAWRAQCEQGFRIDTRDPRWLAEVYRLQQLWATRRQQIGAELADAPGELRRISDMAKANEARLRSELVKASEKLRQAEADAVV